MLFLLFIRSVSHFVWCPGIQHLEFQLQMHTHQYLSLLHFPVGCWLEKIAKVTCRKRLLCLNVKCGGDGSIECIYEHVCA